MNDLFVNLVCTGKSFLGKELNSENCVNSLLGKGFTLVVKMGLYWLEKRFCASVLFRGQRSQFV